jgi:hypothetical protein
LPDRLEAILILNFLEYRLPRLEAILVLNFLEFRLPDRLGPILVLNFLEYRLLSRLEAILILRVMEFRRSGDRFGSSLCSRPLKSERIKLARGNESVGA